MNNKTVEHNNNTAVVQCVSVSLLQSRFIMLDCIITVILILSLLLLCCFILRYYQCKVCSDLSIQTGTSSAHLAYTPAAGGDRTWNMDQMCRNCVCAAGGWSWCTTAARVVSRDVCFVFVVQDGRGSVQTPTAGGAGGVGIPGDQRSAWRNLPTEDPGGPAENHQSYVATVWTRPSYHNLWGPRWQIL